MRTWGLVMRGEKLELRWDQRCSWGWSWSENREDGERKEKFWMTCLSHLVNACLKPVLVQNQTTFQRSNSIPVLYCLSHFIFVVVVVIEYHLQQNRALNDSPLPKCGYSSSLHCYLCSDWLLKLKMAGIQVKQSQTLPWITQNALY